MTTNLNIKEKIRSAIDRVETEGVPSGECGGVADELVDAIGDHLRKIDPRLAAMPRRELDLRLADLQPDLAWRLGDFAETVCWNELNLLEDAIDAALGEGETPAADAVEDRLNQIDGDLGTLRDQLRQLLDAFNGIAAVINQQTSTIKGIGAHVDNQTNALNRMVEVLNELIAPTRPAPPSPNDPKTANEIKEPVATRKRRKTKLSVVPKDGGHGPERRS